MMMQVAWRNLWRHRRRTLITAVAMGIGVALCLAMFALTDGMKTTFSRVLVDGKLGHVQVHHVDYPHKRAMHDAIDQASVRLHALESLSPPPAAVSERLFGFGLVGGKDKTEGGQLMGVDPRSFATFGDIERQIRSGRYLADAPSKEAIVGERMADKLRVGPGDEIVIVTQAADGSMGNDLLQVVGTYRSGDTSLDMMGVITHVADLQELLVMPDKIHEILVRVDDPRKANEHVDRVRDAVSQPLDDPELLVRSWSEASPQTVEMLASVDAQGMISTVVILALASLGVLNTMLMSVFERTRELGVLIACGMRPRFVVTLILTESALLGVLSAAVGALLGGGLVAWLVTQGLNFTGDDKPLDMLGISMDPVIYGTFHPERLALTVSIVFIVSLIAALWPAWRAARLHPVDAMRDH